MSPAAYAALGVLLGSLIGPLVVFTIAALCDDTEELGRVLKRWER
jgi:hypothetical protein